MPSTGRGLRVSTLARAAVALPVLVVVDVLLGLFGLDRAQRVVARLAGAKQEQGKDDVGRPPELVQSDVVGVVRAIDHAALAYRKKGRCLRRSLLVWAWLRRQGLAPEIVLGVRRTPTGLTGHAWVTCGGLPLFESAEVIAANVSFGAFRGPTAR